MDTFSTFKLSPSTLDAIAAKGYSTPSPIQTLSIPPMISGRDLLAEAQTGTGKTAGFGIPLVELHRETANAGVIALILVPTRELALQVSEELLELAKGSGLRIVPIYGGVGFGRQVEALRRSGTILLVATPGRLLDLQNQGAVKLSGVRTLILDEADRMLDMGFVRDVEKIMRFLPPKRQTALFSATLSGDVLHLAKRFMHDPVSVRAPAKQMTADRVEQFHVAVSQPEKQGRLVDLLHAETPESGIVFTRTKHLAKRLADRLAKNGWNAVALQGNMSQGQRERALSAFRAGEARLLVATDVAARGLDIPECSHIVNFDMPDGADSYVHRIGRTARMGRAGRAFTFVQPDEMRDLRQLERAAGSQLARFEVPSSGGLDRPGPDPLPSHAEPRQRGRPVEPVPTRHHGRLEPQAEVVRNNYRPSGGGQPHHGGHQGPRATGGYAGHGGPSQRSGDGMGGGTGGEGHFGRGRGRGNNPRRSPHRRRGGSGSGASNDARSWR